MGCAGGWVLDEGRYSFVERGLSIASPPGGPWKLEHVEGSTLTLRDPAGSTLSWLRTCREHPAPARNESRALLRGLEDVVLESQGPVDAEAADVWRAKARVFVDGREREVHVVTRVVGGCTDDWVLISAPGADVAETFDGWWGSVRAPQVAAGADPEIATEPASGDPQ